MLLTPLEKLSILQRRQPAGKEKSPYARSTLSNFIHRASWVRESFTINLLHHWLLLFRVVSLTELGKVWLKGLIDIVRCRIESTADICHKHELADVSPLILEGKVSYQDHQNRRHSLSFQHRRKHVVAKMPTTAARSRDDHP
jgi:hypothetical protein